MIASCQQLIDNFEIYDTKSPYQNIPILRKTLRQMDIS